VRASRLWAVATSLVRRSAGSIEPATRRVPPSIGVPWVSRGRTPAVRSTPARPASPAGARSRSSTFYARPWAIVQQRSAWRISCGSVT
jgi:hypothetical protein